MENKESNQTPKDFTGGDHSFKSWWKYMWKYATMMCVCFIGALAMFIYIICTYNTFTAVGFWFVLSIPFIVMVIIAYKGLWQQWDDSKKGQSR